MTRARLLVTGGAGLLGANILRRLASEGEGGLVACDTIGHTDREKWRNVIDLPLDDIIAPEDIFPWLDHHGGNLGAIVHMGAISSTTETDGDRILQTNFRLSRDLWRWCARAGANFVYASSAAVYGDGKRGFDDAFEAEALARLRPLNAYGWSKLLFDRWVHEAAARGETPPHWAGLRFFNVYGPGERHKGAMRSVVSKIWPNIAAGEPVELFRSHKEGVPDGGQKRDFVWVGDCADVAVWFAAGGGRSGIYNVGSGRARSFRELAEATFAAAGRAPDIRYVPTPENIRAHYQYFTEAPLDRLRAAGWTAPMTGLEEGVRRYVEEELARERPPAGR